MPLLSFNKSVKTQKVNGVTVQVIETKWCSHFIIVFVQRRMICTIRRKLSEWAPYQSPPRKLNTIIVMKCNEKRQFLRATARIVLSSYYSYCNSVRPFVCLSVCHDQVLIQAQVRYRLRVLTAWWRRVSSLLWPNFVPLGEEIPLEREHRREVLP